MSATPENAATFKRICTERKIPHEKLVELIMQHAQKTGTGVPEVFAIASNLRKELTREKMSPKVLRKGLRVIGLSEEEIIRIIP